MHFGMTINKVISTCVAWDESYLIARIMNIWPYKLSPMYTVGVQEVDHFDVLRKKVNPTCISLFPLVFLWGHERSLLTG